MNNNDLKQIGKLLDQRLDKKLDEKLAPINKRLGGVEKRLDRHEKS